MLFKTKERLNCHHQIDMRQVFAFAFAVLSICSVAHAQVPRTTINSNPRHPTKRPIDYASRRFDFRVYLKDSTVKEIKATIGGLNGRYYLEQEADTWKDMIQPGTSTFVGLTHPGNTIKIERIISVDSALVGIANDTCWLFKVAAGRINLYSVLAQTNEHYIYRMQVGNDGPLQEITRRNVRTAVGDHPDLVEKIKQGYLVEAMRMYNKGKKYWKKADK